MKVRPGGGTDHHKVGGGGANKNFGVFVGKVKDNVDPDGHGRLRVWIAQLSSANESDERGWFTVRYCPPMAGAENTSEESQANNATTRKQTNQSYGMWMVPPHKNVNVICAFLNGEPGQGIWWACLPPDGHTHSLPGLASGQTHDGQIGPVAERNRYNTKDAQIENRPEHPLNNTLKGQGLEKDLRRGQNNAGPFRAKDKHPGYAYGFVSPAQHQLLIDDGEDGNSGQIKLRVKTGASITIDGKDGFINIVNSNGSAWVEIDSDGNVDIYTDKDFSVGALGNINFRAGQSVNIEAGSNINMLANVNIVAEACEVLNLTGSTGANISTNLSMNLLADSQMKLTGQRIDLNGPPAERAALPEANSLVSNQEVGQSIAARVPEKEPYGGHSQRFGEQISTPQGKSNIEPVITPAPDSYNDVPAPTDTNAIDCVPEITQSKLSDDGFKILKSREAYTGMMYSDFQGYSIGYGIRLDIFGPGGGGKIDENLKTALLAGPSEPEARLASRQIIDRENTPRVMRALEKAKQSAAGKTICITQSQIDALIMASYGNPASADRMATDLVAAAASTSDGKPTNEDIAKIWANSPYNNSAKVRDSDARYAMTGKPNPSTLVLQPEALRDSGIKNDLSRLKNNKVQLPESSDWRSPLGNGGQTGNRVNCAYGRATPQHLAQIERSYYLNTGKAAPTTSLTIEQLRDKYGAPHLDGNTPPSSPTKSLA